MNPFLDWLFGMKKKEITISWRIGPVSDQKSHPSLKTRIISGFDKPKENATMALVMTAIQECDLSVSFKDSQGNVAAVENIEWGSSDPGIVLVIPDTSDPSKAKAKATGTVGTGQVNVKADARVGEGTNEIVGLLDVDILAAEASVVEISAGTPVDSPSVEPVRRKK